MTIISILFKESIYTSKRSLKKCSAIGLSPPTRDNPDIILNIAGLTFNQEEQFIFSYHTEFVTLIAIIGRIESTFMIWQLVSDICRTVLAIVSVLVI